MDILKFRIWSDEAECFVNNEGQGILYDDGDWACHCPYDNGCADGHDIYTPDNSVLEMCTGLKDMNGQLIYDGDVVEFWDILHSGEEGHKIGVIKMDTFGVMLQCDGKLHWLGGLFDPDNEIKVIGNIHEDHELQEG